MNRIIINIWLAVGILILSYILWGALDSFNNKDLHKVSMFLSVAGFISCVLHLRTCLKDHADIYKKSEILEKKIDRLAGDLPK